MKKLYCFDFDGTLTHKDTMFLFLKYYSPVKFRIQFLRHIPLFILLKFKLAQAEKVKKSFISSILKDQTKEKLEQKAQFFFDAHFPDIMRENALEFLQKRNLQNTESFLVTASLDIWAKPFADYFKMTLISTRAEYRDGIFTGNFVGRNCNLDEKKWRILKAVEGKKYDKIIAFGDTSGDREMLAWADESHYRFFH